MKKYLVYFALLSICFNPIRAANSLEMGAPATCIMMINQLMQETPDEFYDQVYDFVMPLKQVVDQYINISIPQINEHVADIENKYGGSIKEIASMRVADAKRANILWFEIINCMRELEKGNLVRPLIGSPNEEEKLELNDKDGDLVNSTLYHYFDTGQIKSEKNYKDDKQDGKTTIWYKSGKLKIEMNYKEDKLHGKRVVFYENGQKSEEGNYKDGKEDGKYTQWHKNGQIMMELHYKDGKEDGKWTWWYKNGQKWAERNYKNGECISGWGEAECDDY